MNPKRVPVYTGPTGNVVGSVAITGDEAPIKNDWLEQIPNDCLDARELYKRLFREGMMRSAADVFVAVTGYNAYVPASRDENLVVAKGCAFDTRTVGLTYGQGLDIVSKDMRAYVPELLGARAVAQLVVTPGGKPIRLYPERPGRFVLVDSMRTYSAADVFVVAYSTFDVTRLDGKFEIKGVPVGKLMLNALLPSAMLTAKKEISVEAGKTLTVNLDLHFDLAAYEREERARAAKQGAKPSAPGASAAPVSGALHP